MTGAESGEPMLDLTPVVTCTVPRLRGKTLPAARTALRRAHCTLGKVRRTYSTKVRKGRVISQTPKAGKHLAANAKVAVLLSRGRRPKH